MDINSILNDMITSGSGLLLVAAAYLLSWASAFIPNLFSPKAWNWKKGLEDFAKAFLMGLVLIAGTGILNLGSQFFYGLGWDITGATEAISTFALIGAMSAGFVFYIGKAAKNAWSFFNLKKSELAGDKAKFDEGSEKLGQGVREAIGKIFKAEELNTEEGLAEATLEAEKEEIGGRGRYYPVQITSYDVFRAQVLGNGFDIDGAYGNQCPVAGTMVTMEDGRYLPVELLEEGDVVKGGNKVISNEPKMSKILKVKTAVGTFKVSPEHKLMLSNGNLVEAKDLKEGDIIATDSLAPKAKFDLTDDELKFLGFWLGDGTKKYRWEHSTSPEVFVTVGTPLKEDYLEGLDVTLNKRSHSNGKASVYRLKNTDHKVLNSIIHQLDGKELPQWFSAEQYKLIVEGYLMADGNIHRRGKHAVSTDKELLVGIQFACAVNRIYARLSEPESRDKTNYCDHPKDLYHLWIYPNREFIAKVKEVTTDEDDYVYVLNLDGNHLYWADNFHFHNCWDGCALLWQQIGRTLQTGNGCAYGCWTLKRTENAGSHFTLITNKADVKRGDVVVFQGGKYGHIGFADENYNGGAYIRLMGQNQGGANGNFNVINMSMAGFIGAFRFKPWQPAANNPTPQPTTPQKTNEQIADEVIAGKWGNDPERTQRLKAAGYNRDAIQAVVDAKLNPATKPSPAPKKNEIKVGSTVVPTRLVDYNGTPVRQYDPSYTVIQLTGNRAVLSARGSVWAAMRVTDLRLA